jgi:hypothetical protein
MTNLSFLKIWHHAFTHYINFIVEDTNEAALSPSVVGDAASCRFGKWADTAPRKFRDDPKFATLLGVHAQFHQIGAQLLEIHLDGSHLAHRTLCNRLISSSASLVAAIEEFEESPLPDLCRSCLNCSALRISGGGIIVGCLTACCHPRTG